MKDLVEFLRDRIAEDESVARAASLNPYGDPADRMDWDYGPGSGRDMTPAQDELHRQWSPWRVLAEVAAKRRIMDRAEVVSGMDLQIESEWGTRGSVPWDEDEGVHLLRILALPYADHPDHREEWRP